MRGVVYDGERIEVATDLALREPGAGEVKVRVHAAGLCASDLSVVTGTIPYPTPVVLGHEGAGVVEEVGSSVTSVKPGDHVVLTTLGNCGLCPACETGHPTLCRQTFGNLSQPFSRPTRPDAAENGNGDGDDHGGGATATAADDVKLWNFANASVFADFAVVKETQAVPIDARVPFTSACLVGCGVLTGFGAVVNRARVAVGDTVCVIGVGGIGLNVIQAAAVVGAKAIVAVDTVAAKREIALSFGATHFVDASEGTDTVKAVKEIAPDGVDHAFECVGHPELIRQAVAVLDWGGQCVLLGVPKLGTEASFVVADLYHDRSILGCRYGSSRPRHDIPLIIDLYLAGKLQLDELVTRTVPLEQVGDLVGDMQAGRLARGVLEL